MPVCRRERGVACVPVPEKDLWTLSVSSSTEGVGSSAYQF